MFQKNVFQNFHLINLRGQAAYLLSFRTRRSNLYCNIFMDSFYSDGRIQRLFVFIFGTLEARRDLGHCLRVFI